MQLRRVALPHWSGDPSLGVAGIAVVYAALGEDEDGAGLAGEEGGVKACDAGANDDVVVAQGCPPVAARGAELVY